MGARYLTDLAAWLAADGLAVYAYDGWQSRGRSSGGYEPGRPWCVVWHHTASDAAPASDAGYIAEGDPDAPLANLMIDRAGIVWVIAAGATNTNGKGGPWTVSRGTIPADQLNTHAVGVEICNAGTGEPYPPEQIAAAFTVSLTLTSRLGLDPSDALEHVEWAPGRKIDPATAAAATGFWPRSINSSGSWNGDDLRAELAARAGTAPAPTPPPNPPEDDDMAYVALDEHGTAWIGNLIDRRPIADAEQFDRLVALGVRNTAGQPVHGWSDVATVDQYTLDALGTE